MPRKNKIFLGQKVFIKSLSIDGTIVSIWKTLLGTRYEVRYFNNNKEPKEVYFYKDELECYNKQNEKLPMGFTR